jgi:hypothetical protein
MARCKKLVALCALLVAQHAFADVAVDNLDWSMKRVATTPAPECTAYTGQPLERTFDTDPVASGLKFLGYVAAQVALTSVGGHSNGAPSSPCKRQF